MIDKHNVFEKQKARTAPTRTHEYIVSSHIPVPLRPANISSSTLGAHVESLVLTACRMHNRHQHLLSLSRKGKKFLLSRKTPTHLTQVLPPP